MADPIKFTDGEGVECSLKTQTTRGLNVGLRDATPDDLARCGYRLLRVRHWPEPAEARDPELGMRPRSELSSLRALERRIRAEGEAWCERHQLAELLKAIDEARK
jgi:hypothetical protein